MLPGPLPGDTKKAIALLRAEPARPWTIDALASACGVSRRTLQKHFHRFVGRAPLLFLRELRLEEARRRLLSTDLTDNVMQVAAACGFAHPARFAAWYRRRYDESPSTTVRHRRPATGIETRSLPPLPAAVERPGVAILPFDLVGPEAGAAAGLAEEIAAGLWHLRWISLAAPTHARYHLRGKVRAEPCGRLHATLTLLDVASGRCLWADSWDGPLDDLFGFEDRVSIGVKRTLQPVVRDAEVSRAQRTQARHPDAWELTMRALPSVLSAEPTGMARALEWLQQAMELAPQDSLPVSLAAWCHAVRAGHNCAPEFDAEKQAARRLAARASLLDSGDPSTEAMLAAAHSLSGDLDAASLHVEKALALDGGSAWAWGRSGWLNAFRGKTTEAIEHFQIARALAPTDPLSHVWATGIGTAQFESGRHAEAARWFRQGLAEQPKAITIHRLLAPVCVLTGAREEAKESLTRLLRAFPDLTITQATTGLPLTRDLLARWAEGLESVGMRPC